MVLPFSRSSHRLTSLKMAQDEGGLIMPVVVALGSYTNPTFAIRASGLANPLSFRGVDSQGRHYSEFAEAEFWTSPKRRICGGGC